MADSKRAFEASHTTVYMFYPDQLCIVGGADLPDERMRGPLDTSGKDTYKEEGVERRWNQHTLYTPKRLEQGFKPGFIETIDLLGVITAIVIVKLLGVPTVNFGRHRVMGTRIVNWERKKKCGVPTSTSDEEAARACVAAGFPLYKIKCDYKNDASPAAMLARMGVENFGRNDDDLASTIELVGKYVDVTNDPDMAARLFLVEPVTIQSWLAFYRNASPATLAASKKNQISVTAAAKLAAVEDHTKQNELLQQLLSAPTQTVREAAAIVRKHKGGKRLANPFHGRKELTRFGSFVVEHRDRSGFWDGIEAFLELMTTGKTEDQRLTKLFKKFTETGGKK